MSTPLESLEAPEVKLLPSGFGAQSTADEVLRDANLSGKIAFITGASSGYECLLTF